MDRRGALGYGTSSCVVEALDAAVRSCAVVRVAARSEAERGWHKWTSPARPCKRAIRIERSGVVGDYNRDRMVAGRGTLDRAVSLLTLESLATLRRDGYDIRPGDLGENLTLNALDAELFPGVRLRLSTRGASDRIELEITEPMVPCQNLERLPVVVAMPERARRAFPRACKGRRGWYARVLAGGELSPGSSLLLLAPPRPAQGIVVRAEAAHIEIECTKADAGEVRAASDGGSAAAGFDGVAFACARGATGADCLVVAACCGGRGEALDFDSARGDAVAVVEVAAARCEGVGGTPRVRRWHRESKRVCKISQQ